MINFGNKSSILVLILIIGIIVSASGCTTSVKNNTTNTTDNNSAQQTESTSSEPIKEIKGDGYYIYDNYGTVLDSFSVEQAKEATEPSEFDEGLYEVTDYGTKTIAGLTVYYNVYNILDSGETGGDLYFEKGGKWHHITWTDKSGNPNKDQINKDVERMINSL